MTDNLTQIIDNNSIYDLDLDNIVEDDSGYVPAALSKGGREKYDKTWSAHRQTKIGKHCYISWRFPSTKKQRDAGAVPPEELNDYNPKHKVVAVRGIVVGYNFGFQLSEGEGASSKVVCRTTKLIEHTPKGDIVTNGNRPLTFPVSQIHKSKASPTELNNRLQGFDLYGSRGPVGSNSEDKVTTTRTCQECVAAGENYIGTPDQFSSTKLNIPKCSMSGELLFVVFQLGIEDFSELLEDPVNGKGKVRWSAIGDCDIQTLDGDGNSVKLDRPFVLRLDGITKTQLWSIGKGQYDRPVLLPDSGSSKCILPARRDDKGGYALYTCGDYFDYLNDSRFYGTRAKVWNGVAVYPVVTELYSGRLKENQYQSDFIPVLSPVDPDAEQDIVSAGIDWTPNDWVKTALRVVKAERDAANSDSNFVEFQAPQLTAVDTKQLESATSATSTAKPKAPTAQLGSNAFSSFKVEKKV
jgi:hypothetical protein